MIIATAGHVDHGKTLLVNRLTGMDTDRLEEEKRRGLSINLGFAWRESAPGIITSFVDVPGHQRFINNMIAGISGIHVGMLVVAADDGPMPQTQEHMDVLQLLGITRFVLVITKVDRVDGNRVKAVEQQCRQQFNPLQSVQCFAVSSTENSGIAELTDYLDSLARNDADEKVSGHFRLSVDRAFHIKGSGLVVTGTVSAGQVSPGQSLTFLPHEQSVRVRSLQVQEREQEVAKQGQRCALNITGDVAKEDIQRGDWLVGSDKLNTSKRFDASIELLASAPGELKHMQPLKVYLGAARVPARVALLQSRTLQSGQRGFAQLVLLDAIHCCHGDRFVLRDDSESVTLGGGRVLDSSPPAQRRNSSVRLDCLDAFQAGDPFAILSKLLHEKQHMQALDGFCANLNISDAQALESSLLQKDGPAIKFLNYKDESYVLDMDSWGEIENWLMERLGKGNEAGVERHQLAADFAKVFPGHSLKVVLNELQVTDTIETSSKRICLKKAGVQLEEKYQRHWQSIENHLQKCGLQVPVVVDMATDINLDTKTVNGVCAQAVGLGWLVKVANNRFVLAAHMQTFADAVRELVAQASGFSVADYKNRCGIGRNLAIEVLEYFDSIGFTLRKGGSRVILKPSRMPELEIN